MTPYSVGIFWGVVRLRFVFPALRLLVGLFFWRFTG